MRLLAVVGLPVLVHPITCFHLLSYTCPTVVHSPWYACLCTHTPLHRSWEASSRAPAPALATPDPAEPCISGLSSSFLSAFHSWSLLGLAIVACFLPALTSPLFRLSSFHSLSTLADIHLLLSSSSGFLLYSLVPFLSRCTCLT
jgi:hypothetical protein